MRNKKLAAVFLAVLLAGCSATNPSTKDGTINTPSSISQNIQLVGINSTLLSQDEISAFDKEYTFSTMALTKAYIKKKIQKWLLPGNGAKLVKEIKYAMIKGPLVIPFADMVTENNLGNEISTHASIIAERLTNSDLNTFLTNNGITPPPPATKIAYVNAYKVWKMNSDGTGKQQFLGLSDNYAYYAPSWSADGTKIAFGIQNSEPNYHLRIGLADANGNNLTNVTSKTASYVDKNDDTPNLSADGTKITYTSDRGEGPTNIYTINANGSNDTCLTCPNTWDNNYLRPTWSPDGTKIAFFASIDESGEGGGGNNEIYVMDANGSNIINLTNNIASDSGPSWSKDGTQIAFMSNRGGGGTSEIYVMNANGTSPTRVTTNAYNEDWLNWSPDGTQISFQSDREGNYNNSIFVINIAGTVETRLTDGSANCTNSSWSN